MITKCDLELEFCKTYGQCRECAARQLLGEIYMALKEQGWEMNGDWAKRTAALLSSVSKRTA